MAIRPATIRVDAKKGTFDEDVQELVSIVRSKRIQVQVEAQSVGGKSSAIIPVAELEQAEKLLQSIETRIEQIQQKGLNLKVRVDTTEFDNFVKRAEQVIDSKVRGITSGSASGGGGPRAPRQPGNQRPSQSATFDPVEYRAIPQYQAEQRFASRQRQLAQGNIQDKSLELRQKRQAVQEASVALAERNLASRENAVKARELRTQSSLSRAQKSSNSSRADDSEEAIAIAQYKAKKAYQRNVVNPARVEEKRKQREQAQKDNIQRRINDAQKEFGEQTKFNEFGAYVGGLFSGNFTTASQVRLAQRAKNAQEFAGQQRFKNVPGLEQALIGNIGAGKNPALFNAHNIFKPEVAQQIGFGGVLGGLPGIAATAVGGLVGGLPGALAASTIQQTIQGVLIDPIISAFNEHKEEFVEAGQAYSRSILGVQASLQASTTVVGAGGGRSGLQASLAFQERQAQDIQGEARKRLLPLGISGSTEATFVQGLQQAIASRGIQTSAKGLSEIAGIVGGDIAAQRRGLLDNPNLLLRDLGDYFSGGALSKRTILSNLGGLRQASTGIQNATSEEDILKALRPAAVFEQTVRNSDNITAVQQRNEGAQEQLKSIAGTELLNTIKGPLAEFTKTLGGTDTENTFKNIGRVFGEVSAAGINFTNTMYKLGNSVSTSLQPLGQFALIAGKLVPGLGNTIGDKETEEAGDRLAASIRKGGAAGSRISDSQLLQNLLSTGGLEDKVKSYEEGQISNPLAVLSGISRSRAIFGDSEEFKNRLPGILSAQVGLQEDDFKNRSRIFGPGFAANALHSASINERLGTLQELAGLNRNEASPIVGPQQDNSGALLNEIKGNSRQARQAEAKSRELANQANTLGQGQEVRENFREIGLRFSQSVLSLLPENAAVEAAVPGGGKQLLLNKLGVGNVVAGATRETLLGQSAEEQDRANAFRTKAFQAGQNLFNQRVGEAFGTPEETQKAAAFVDTEQKILELRKEGLQVIESDTKLLKERFDSIAGVFQGFGAGGGQTASTLGVRAGNRQLADIARKVAFLDETKSQIEGVQAGIGGIGGRGQAKGILSRFAGQDLNAAKLDIEDQKKQAAIEALQVRRQQFGNIFANVESIGQTFGENASGFNTGTVAGQLAGGRSKIGGLTEENKRLQAIYNSNIGGDGISVLAARQAGLRFNQNQNALFNEETQQGLRGFRQQELPAQIGLAQNRGSQLLQEEANKRQSLNAQLEQSRIALANFSVGLNAVFADKGEQILAAADQVRAAGGHTQFDNLSDEDRKQISLKAKTARLNSLLSETGLGSEQDQGQFLGGLSPKFIGGSSQFDFQNQQQLAGLRQQASAAQLGLANLPFESKIAQTSNQRELFSLQRENLGANLPSYLPLPNINQAQQDQLDKLLPDDQAIKKSFSGDESKDSQADLKQLASSVKDIKEQIARIQTGAVTSDNRLLAIATTITNIDNTLTGKPTVKLEL